MMKVYILCLMLSCLACHVMAKESLSSTRPPFWVESLDSLLIKSNVSAVFLKWIYTKSNKNGSIGSMSQDLADQFIQEQTSVICTRDHVLSVLRQQLGDRFARDTSHFDIQIHHNNATLFIEMYPLQPFKLNKVLQLNQAGRIPISELNKVITILYREHQPRPTPTPRPTDRWDYS
eukprot:522150_1